MNDSDVTHCYRHDDRRAGVICQRCDKPICPDCMSQASVGFHCPECAKSGKQKVIRGPAGFDPVITKALIGVNVAVFVFGLFDGGTLTRAGGRLFVEGALWAPPIDTSGEYWRIVTSGFLHGGLLHLAFNSYALWIMGPQLERALGRSRFGVLYAAGLLGGSLGALLLDPLVPVIGASGAVFGLFGAMAAVQRAMGISIWDSGLGPILAINFVLTLGLSFISVGGHLGGFLLGLGVGSLYVAMAKAGRGERAAALTGAGICVALALGSVWAATLWMNPLF